MQQVLDELIKNEEESIKKLKNELRLINEVNGSPNHNFSKIVHKDEAIIHIGISRFDYKISTSASFADFEAFIKSKISKNFPAIGFEFLHDKTNFSILLKDDSDLELMYDWYFSNNISFVKILPIKQSESFQKLNLSNTGSTCSNEKEEKKCPFIFVPSHEFPVGVFVTVSKSATFEQGMSTLRSLSENIESVSFTDSDGDSLSISEEEEWEYFIAEASTSYQKGSFAFLYANEE
ncbi:hypothetical protein TRFO_19218 [Tritrichomonas foetus]|uniref:PB1 domain-containing protein n=1 Tax=Tritrichomonas foetus TaxID=1144522 RepID=A0A1J4KPJ3_9EUKA|nr:hypothetical protein TRFO_19218 [Tritrichomonas foetus]|eukprot:OHT11341.1 hypothetical protein TRFO_19218 [Tritrichomonas foetus]